MSSPPVDRILRETNLPTLVDVLAGLPPTDFQSLMLEVTKERAKGEKPGRILEQYRSNRFVQPSNVDPRTRLRFEQLAFEVASPQFEPIDLAPVCPLGATSSLSTVSQNNVVATVRNTEVVSDSTNCMALECALRRRELLRHGKPLERVRLCSAHRLTRAQTFSGPATFAHFQVFSLCTSGRDEGNSVFEFESLQEQISIYLRLLARMTALRTRLELTDFTESLGDELKERVMLPLVSQFPVEVRLAPERVSGRGYYDRICFQIIAQMPNGEELSVADGGFTSWTAQLLSNQKERLLISGIGAQRMCSLFEFR